MSAYPDVQPAAGPRALTGLDAGAPWRSAARAARAAAFCLEAFGRMRVGVRAADARERVLEQATLARALAREACSAMGIIVVDHGAVPDGPCVVVANHTSWIDPLVLLTRVSGVTVAKAEVGRWPLVGPCATGLGTLLVDRGVVDSGVRVLRGARRALRHGVPVLGFPEGTTSRGGLLPFRRGLIGLARSLGVPVVPVALSSSAACVPWVDDDALVPHALRLFAERRLTMHVTVTEPFVPDRAQSTGFAVARVRRQLQRALPEQPS